MTRTRTLVVSAVIGCAGMIAAAQPGVAQKLEIDRPALPFPPNLAEIAAYGSQSERRLMQEQVGRGAASDGGTGRLAQPFAGSLLPQDSLGAAESLALKIHLESICGIDDSQDVELYNGALGPSIDFVNKHEPSTLQLQWNVDLAAKYQPPSAEPGNVSGVRWCTGTLIDEDVVLTAGHCFDQTGGGWIRPRKVVSGSWQIISPQEIATNMHVNFNYQRDGKTFQIRNADVFPITELIEYRPAGLDVAVIRIGSNQAGRAASESYPITTVSTEDVPPDAAITMMQHPAGQPKKVEAGKAEGIDNGLLLYGDLDTQGGSSGSGVLSDAGKLVGVHIRGGCTSVGGFNKAVPISIIRAQSSYFGQN